MAKNKLHFNDRFFGKKSAKTNWDSESLSQGILNGEIGSLSRAITLIESRDDENSEIAQDVLNTILPKTGKSIRVAITGVPGVGKSTFIEQLGMHLIGLGKKVAVLAIDPTSQVSKGSILGDKTRMNLLSREKNAFIRPSPTAESLGGVAQKTKETIYLCEAAGYDVILVETVGVGQSEIAAHAMVDFFLLLKLAGAGDQLQGIKRGIVEMADMVLINKADGGNVKLAKSARVEMKQALHLFPAREDGWQVPTLCISALEKMNIDQAWLQVESYVNEVKKTGFFDEKRTRQAQYWLEKTINDELVLRFYKDEKIKGEFSRLKQQVTKGEISPFTAAQELLGLHRS